MKFLTSINLLQNELQNTVIQPLAIAPESPVEGQIYYNSTKKTLEQYDGTKWNVVGKEYTLPTASADVLGGIKVGAGLQISDQGTLSTTGGGVADSVEWSGVLDTPTDLAGYGITDAKIVDGVITLGATTIIPITSLNGKTGGTITLSAEDVNALPTAGGTMTGAITMGTNKITGLGSPEADTDAVTKKYADDSVADVVKYTEQTLEDAQKVQARANIGAGTSSFDGKYTSLTDLPTIDTEMKADSENAVQNKVIKAYVDQIVAASQGVVYKGTINVVGDIPTTYEVGWLYVIGTAGTYVGQECEVGDLMIALVARQGAGNENTDWDVIQTNIEGAITELTGDDPISVTGTGTSREIALNNSGVTTGGYGDTTDQTPAFGVAFKVPHFVVDQYGRLTTADEHMVTIPATVATDGMAGLMSAEDHTAFTSLKTDVADLKTRAITKVVATITTGQTSATATIGDGVDVLSVSAFNATSGEEIMIDVSVSGTTLMASIAKAVTYDIKVVVTTL